MVLKQIKKCAEGCLVKKLNKKKKKIEANSVSFPGIAGMLQSIPAGRKPHIYGLLM